jgi:hypothetical protein
MPEEKSEEYQKMKDFVSFVSGELKSFQGGINGNRYISCDFPSKEKVNLLIGIISSEGIPLLIKEVTPFTNYTENKSEMLLKYQVLIKYSPKVD